MINAEGSWGDFFEFTIPTRAGVEKVIVDYDQADNVRKISRWVLYKDPKGRKMARADKADGQVLLHRHLFDIPPGYKLEWLNGNTLDCRRKNLQLVNMKTKQTITLYEPDIRKQHKDPNSTYEVLKEMAAEGHPEAQKVINKLNPSKEETSKERGVYRHKHSDRWHASAFYEKKRYSLGYFAEEADAIEEVKLFRSEGPASPKLKRNQRK